MNYQIIKDIDKLRQFIDWLPELKPNELYYIALYARSKYCKDIAHISSDKQQLGRFAVTKSKIELKIRQLETAVGSYKQFNKGIVTEIPQEALSCYIYLNPKDQRKAALNLSKELIDVLAYPDSHSKLDLNQMVLTSIHKAKSKTRFVIADFDNTDVDTVRQSVEPYIDLDKGIEYLITRGGVHLIIDVNNFKPKVKNWYNSIQSLSAVDKISEMASPIPGTYQGGHVPYFYKP